MSEVRCELCGTRDARYVCTVCGRDACTDCYRLQLGICHRCSPA